MHIPRVNWLFFGIYTLITASILAAALLLPDFRANSVLAGAPLRDWLLDSALPAVLPKPDPVTISVLYSTEKDAWLQEVIQDFAAGDYAVDGHPIVVELEKMGSREIYLSVLDETRKPDIISPASFLQISILQDLSTSKFGKPLVNRADKPACQSVVTTPLVMVAWKERADVLWGTQPGSEMWQDLHNALTDPKGWSAYSHPEWGYVKFGQTDPLKSNSGFMAILLMTYSYFDKTSGLTSDDILSNPDFQKWFLEIQNAISQYESSTGPLMQKMVAFGPSTYDLVAVYEATAIEQAANAVGRYGELRVYYPPATILSDHPFCILNGDWVTPQKAQAAQIFINYLLSKPVQEKALLKYGFHPVDTSISLDQTGSPFLLYRDNGLRSDISGLPVVEVPDGNVLNTLQEFWSRNIKP